MPKIVRTTDPLNVGGIFGILYGEDGIGKTTLAMTAADCVVAMYDPGFKRSLGRKDAVAFSNWQDIVDYFDINGNCQAQGQKSPFREDFPAAKTVIHDTVGILQDKYLAPYVAKMRGNHRPDGSLSLQGYGAMKHAFSAFLQGLERDGLNHLFIAHVAVPEGEDGEQKLRPRLSGGSYNLLMERADFCGFIETTRQGKICSLDADGRKVGKNTGQVPVFRIPKYGTPEFGGQMQKIIDKTRTQMETLAMPPENLLYFKKQLDTVETLDELKQIASSYPEEAAFCAAELEAKEYHIWEAKATTAKTVDDFNAFIEEAKKRTPPRKRELFATLMTCAKQAELAYDRDSALFYEAVGEHQEKPAQPPKSPDTANPQDTGKGDRDDKDWKTAESIRNSLNEGVSKAVKESLIPVAKGIADKALREKLLSELSR